jgi:hypothetical protein
VAEGGGLLRSPEIMSSEPPPIAALQSAHPLLDHVLRRCLEKDRERRWQSIGDVTGELRWIVDHPMAAPAEAAPPTRSNRVGRAAMIVTLVLAMATAAARVRILRGRGAAVDLPTLRFEIATAPTDDSSMAQSPDGTEIAFVANRDRVPLFWVRSLDAPENRALAGTEGASFPFWSPDGRTIVLRGRQGSSESTSPVAYRWWSLTLQTLAAAPGTLTA